jgi:hypothetical protein
MKSISICRQLAPPLPYIPAKGEPNMKSIKHILLIASIFAIAILLVSCDIPGDLDLDFSDYEIFPSGNPTWPDDSGGGGTPYWGFNLFAAAAGDIPVAVGTKEAILVDDTIWKIVPTPLYNYYYDIVWADTAFIAVGNFVGVATSRDGLVWKSFGGGNYCLQSVAYSGTRAVAVGNSYNASNFRWKSAAFVFNAAGTLDTALFSDSLSYLTKILWADSQFIAFGVLNYAGIESTIVITSDDGYHWENLATTSLPRFIDVIWCNDHYLAASGNIIYRSSDGVTWSEVAELAGDVRRLYRHSSTYLAVGLGGHVSVSVDGIVWNKVPLPANCTSNIFAAVYYNNLYYIFGDNRIFKSADAKTWTTCTIQYSL